MLADSFLEDLSLLWPAGVALSIEERMNVHLALLKVHEYEDFEEVLFWGKVRGIHKDYFIAVALNYAGQHEFPTKRFFWCSSSNWAFAELPAPSGIDASTIESFNTLFTGEHDKVLVQAAEDEEGGKDFTELDRLAHVVRQIDNDCSVVPVGAFRMTPAHELARNRAFGGLNRDEAKLLKHFCHFRPAQLPDKKEQLQREQVLLTYDFLDSVEADNPKGVWSHQIDPSGELVSLRSLLWSGYCAFHKANTNKFGWAYMGDGVKNLDLAFML